MEKLSPFLTYLSTEPQDGEKLPSLVELSDHLGISTASLREQMEVARSMGWIEVKPKTGIRRLPYSVKQTLLHSVRYGSSVDPSLFSQFSDLRRHIETAYWFEAVTHLKPEDIFCMENLVSSAEGKLARNPVQLPHPEHRALHLAIYKNLENPLVVGMLEAYWDLYELVGYSVYADLGYLKNVWSYHRKIVGYIKASEFDLGHSALVDHMALLGKRDKGLGGNSFE